MFPLGGYDEKCGYEYLWTRFRVDLCFHFSRGKYIGVELLASYD